MKTISTTDARSKISSLINAVRETGTVFAIGRRNHPEALLIKFPRDYNVELNDITNMNAYSDSFDFLEKEPDLYTVEDIKKQYAQG